MYRHGELIIKNVSRVKGRKLSHLILAEGETTGHKHAIAAGDAELFEHKGILYLRVSYKNATLTHPDHRSIDIPAGDYEITRQREYVIGEAEYRRVVD